MVKKLNRSNQTTVSFTLLFASLFFKFTFHFLFQHLQFLPHLQHLQHLQDFSIFITYLLFFFWPRDAHEGLGVGVRDVKNRQCFAFYFYVVLSQS